MNSLAIFLQSLFDDGRIRVNRLEEIVQSELDEARTWLLELDTHLRSDLPEECPSLNADVALKAAVLVYRAAQLLVFREYGEDDVQRAFEQHPKVTPSPADHYSVDLTFRFVRDLLRLGKTAAAEDPLNDYLIKTLNDWPLSAVGVDACKPPARHAVLQHEGLRRLYVDRVLERGDRRATDDPWLVEQIKIAVGANSELVSWVSVSDA